MPEWWEIKQILEIRKLQMTEWESDRNHFDLQVFAQSLNLDFEF